MQPQESAEQTKAATKQPIINWFNDFKKVQAKVDSDRIINPEESSKINCLVRQDVPLNEIQYVNSSCKKGDLTTNEFETTLSPEQIL